MVRISESERDRFKQNEDQVVIVQEEYHNIGWGCRHQQVFILFCCYFLSYTMRCCMGVSLVAMTNKAGLNETENGTLYGEEVSEHGSVGLFNGIFFTEPFPTFEWSKKIQDAIMAAFYWGYMTLQLPAGQLAHRFGTRYLLTGSMLINGVIAFCTPWAVYHGGWILAVVFRIIQGCSQSCALPAIHTALGKWAPLQERGRLASIAYGGQPLGLAGGMLISGLLAGSPLGWPGIFRFYGILACVVAAIVWFFCADSPVQHRSISVHEKRYIEDALLKNGPKRHLKVPWKKLLLCKGLYAIIFSHTGYAWGHLTLYMEIPAFMDKVMKIDIKANGSLMALPFFMMWLSHLSFSWVTDKIIAKKYLSVTYTRKLANTIGTVPSGVALIALAYVRKDIYVVEIILVLICSLTVACNTAYLVNHIDISPNYAGTMVSISNFLANGISSMAPMVAAFYLTDVTNELLWRKVFFTTAGVFFFSNLVYVILGTSELADWNEPEKEKKLNGEEYPMIKSRSRR